MSASLVGSEMCIRDRGYGRPQRPNAHRRAHGSALDPVCRSRGASSCTPVSYTHLTLPTICSV
eukprot:8372479-Alexandrium_andersonii.AAC.1